MHSCRSEVTTMAVKMFGIYEEIDTLELVAVIKAEDLGKAKEKAGRMGYGSSYRVEELDDE